MINRVWDFIQWRKIRAYYAARYLYDSIRWSDYHATARELIWIDPAKVDRLLVPRFQINIPTDYPQILNGAWDTNELDMNLYFASEYEDIESERGTVSFCDYTLYKSLKNRFKYSKSWENTELYNWMLEDNEQDIPRYSSIKEVEDRCEFIDNLYESIRSNGYQTQKELGENNLDEILVNIGRGGEIIFDDGRHRFCIAKILGLESIPVRVLVRHTKWQQKRSSFSTMGTDRKSNVHPDLQNIAPEHK